MAHHNSDRRRILMSGAVAAGTAVWSVPIFGATSMDALSFVIVSDTHLGRKDSENAEKQWRKAIDEINGTSARFVLHLGDIVDQGREAQYPIYQQTRELLNKPIHEIPGNHDPLDLFQKYVTAESDQIHDYDGVRFILLSNAHRDSHDGFFTAEQLAWMDQACAEAVKADRNIVICCHVPIHSNRHPDRGWYVKPAHGQSEFYELQQRYSEHLLASFHGHFHNGIRGWRDHGRTAEILFPSVCYNQNRNLQQHISDGTADGFFVDELRPGYVLAELGRDRLTLRCKPLGEPTNGEYSAEW